MEYMTVQEAAKKWNITKRWVQNLCEENRVNGAVWFIRVWMIPKDAKKPGDGRRKEKINE